MDASLLRPLVRQRLILGGVLLALGISLGVTFARAAGNAPLPLDRGWMDEMLTSRASVLLGFGYAMNWIGGGWFSVVGLPVIILALLWLRGHRWGAVFFAVSALVSVGVVQVLKRSFERPRPLEILTASDAGSFPSGHTANAATIAVVLFIIFPRVWVAIAGAVWVLLMAFSRTLMGAHWASDTVGGALIGAGVVLLVAAAFAVPLSRERMLLPKPRDQELPAR